MGQGRLTALIYRNSETKKSELKVELALKWLK
ncbi:hypothetical protein M272_13190 [Vibrio natriegens NBRC 15636 = ATCC 14048 = DSM 759]|nr:hypothetical protein M272_13190 [Vibrio natriegens NBRC 15636 = ATCC 14048 = DSM 759]